MTYSPYQLVGIPSEIRLLHPETINKLLTLRLKNDFETLHGPKLRGRRVFAMRGGRTERILFIVLVDDQGTRTLCFYKYLPTHDYDAAKREIEAHNDQKFDLNKLLDGLELLPIIEQESNSDDMGISSLADEEYHVGHIYYDGRDIPLDGPQTTALNTTSTTQVLTGPPGSGKTCVIAKRLELWANEAAAPGLSLGQSSSSSRVSMSSSSSAASSTTPPLDAIATTGPTIFYVTESKDLQNHMKKAMENQLSPDALDHIEYCDYESLLKRIDPDTHGKLFLSKTESKDQFFNNKEIKSLFSTLTASAEKVKKRKGASKTEKTVDMDMFYQEFLLIAGLSLPAYLNQGVATSHFAHLSPKERTLIFKAYHPYCQELKDQNVVDPWFYHPTTACIQNLHTRHPNLRIAVDETQDYPPVPVLVMHQAAYEQRIIYGIDTHQQIGSHLRLSVREYLIRQLKAEPLVLTDSYRLPNTILDMSNVTLKLKALAADKRKSDKDDYAALIRSEGQRAINKVGFVKWVAMPPAPQVKIPAPTLHRTKNKKATATQAPNTPPDPHIIARLPADQCLQDLIKLTQGRANVAVITRPELVVELKKLLGTTPVMAPEDIKGLEYDTIITWDLLNDPSLHEANAGLPDDPLTAKSAQGRSKDKKDQLRQHDCVATFNKIYTAQTRATRALYMYEFEDEHRLGKITRAYRETIRDFGASNQENDADKPGISTPKAWRELMDRYIQHGDLLNAHSIWADDSCWLDVSATERGESFDAYREQRFALAHPPKTSHAASSVSSSSSSSASSSAASSSSPPSSMHFSNKGPKRKSHQQKPNAAAHSHPTHRSPVTSSAPLRQQLDHRTELHNACMNGDREKLQALLRQGIDPNTPLEEGDSALYIAACYGHIDCMQLLLDKGAKPNSGRYRPIFGATLGKHIDAVKMLLPKIKECGPDEKCNIFNACIKIANTEIINFLTSKEGVVQFFSHLTVTKILATQFEERDAHAQRILMTACSNVKIDLLAAALYTGANCNFEYAPPVSETHLQLKVTPLITLLIKVVTTNTLTNEVLASILLLKNYGANIEASQRLLEQQFPHDIGHEYAYQLGFIAKYHKMPPPFTSCRMPKTLIEEAQCEQAIAHKNAYILDITMPASDRLRDELARKGTDESHMEIQALFESVQKNLTASTALTQVPDALFYHMPTSTVLLEAPTVTAEADAQTDASPSKSM